MIGIICPDYHELLARERDDKDNHVLQMFYSIGIT